MATIAAALLLGALERARRDPHPRQADRLTGHLGGPDHRRPRPVLLGPPTRSRVGARAYRFELNDPSHSSDMSAWYHLAYVVGGDRLQLYEHNPPTT